VSEQPWLGVHDAPEPAPGALPSPSEPPVFAHGPLDEEEVKVLEDSGKNRPIVGPIVVQPAPKDRIERPGQDVQGCVTAMVETPAPHGLADRLGSFAAYRRREADEVFRPLVLDLPRPEGEAQEVELVDRIVPPSAIILA
jgi:hypothetical protein